MTATQLEKALKAIPTALKYEHHCNYVLHTNDIFNNKITIIKNCLFQHFFSFNNKDFIVELYLCNSYNSNYFVITPLHKKIKLFELYIIEPDLYNILKNLFYNKISIDEFLNYFKIDKGIFYA